MDRLVGKRIDGRYEIKDVIGVGGMAVVYKAYDNADDKIVAIKILRQEFLANDEFRRRFKNESKAIAVLSHPNIVKVFDVSFGDLLQYIVMEYIDGITLKQYIMREGVIDWKEAVSFLVQILKALEHAHDKGIVHRDIKPQNIMVLANGTIKVTDFGIARFSKSEQKTITDKAIGSVHYISPEQARGELTNEKADIYSVGVLLYEMISGRVPFQADSAVSVAIMQLQNSPKRPTAINPNIPRGLEEITLRAMQKNQQDRYASAEEMLVDLDMFINDPTITFSYSLAMPSEDNISKTQVVRIDKEKNVPEFEHRNGTKKKKTSVLPILVGVTVVLVLALSFILYLFLKGDPNSSATINCPNFVGQKYTELAEKYAEYQFKFIPTYVNSSDYKEGYVVYQTIDPGKELKRGQQIDIKVSKGAIQVGMPDLVDKHIDTAKEELELLKLKYKIIEISSTVKKENVVSTDPVADTLISEDEEVLIYVSSGQALGSVMVPDISGLSRTAAEDYLTQKGLKLGVVEYEDSYAAKDTVVSQSPAAQQKVDQGTVVDIVLSKGNLVDTTKTAYSAVILVNLPIMDKSVNVSGWIDGEKVYQSDKIDLSTGVQHQFTVNLSNPKAVLTVYLDSVPYMDYTIDFTTDKPVEPGPTKDINSLTTSQ